MVADQPKPAEGRAGDPSRLQPGDGSVDWDSSAEKAAAEELDRRIADKVLIDELRKLGFSGPDFDWVAGELARYGMSVIHSWIMSMTIFEKVAQKGRPVQRPPFRTWQRDEAQSLTNEVVARALANFVDDVLRPGKWDPHKGASVTTFFVGQCLLTFPNAYRGWLKHYDDARPSDDILEGLMDGQMSGPEDDVIRSAMAARALSEVRSVEAKKAFVMTALGYPQAEIAVAIGTTEKAVERMISYARKHIRKKDSA